MKWYSTLFVAAAVAVGGWLAWRHYHPTAVADAGAVETVVVHRGSIVQSVSATARVVSRLDVDIKCKASGKVIQLPFDISDSVKEGDLLLEVDPIEDQRSVKQAEAALAAAEAKLAQAKQNLVIAQRSLVTSRDRANTNLTTAEARAKEADAKAKRRKELLDSKLTSQEDYDTAETLRITAQTDLATARIAVEELAIQDLGIEVKRQDVKLADAQVLSDKQVLATVQQRLDDTRVQAPISGVVTGKNVEIGTIISSGITNIGGGTTVMSLADLSKTYVLASVDESDIGRVSLGQPVSISADAFLGTEFTGKVVRIATRGVNITNVVTFEVKIEVGETNRALLKPEMTTNVQIVSGRKDGVLLAPVQAVSRDAGRFTVKVFTAAGTQEQRFVQVGLNDGDNWEITSGLADGDKVVLNRGEVESKWRGGATPGAAPRQGPPPPQAQAPTPARGGRSL